MTSEEQKVTPKPEEFKPVVQRGVVQGSISIDTTEPQAPYSVWFQNGEDAEYPDRYDEPASRGSRLPASCRGLMRGQRVPRANSEAWNRLYEFYLLNVKDAC